MILIVVMTPKRVNLFEFLKYDEFKKYVDKSTNEKDSYPLVLSFVMETLKIYRCGINMPIFKRSFRPNKEY